MTSNFADKGKWNWTFMVAAALCLTAAMQPAQAGRFGAMGSRGGAGAYNQQGQYAQRFGAGAFAYGRGGAAVRGARFQGPNGGSGGRAGLTAVAPGMGVHASASQGTTGNGGTFQRGGATGWQNGVGAAHQSVFSGSTASGGSLDRQGQWQYKNGEGGSSSRGFQAQAANGASASGYKNGQYDAATGSGTMSKGRDYNTTSGESYGYDANTAYTKGQGFTTTVDTQNKTDYTVQYNKGEKPVVTPVPAP